MYQVNPVDLDKVLLTGSSPGTISTFIQIVAGIGALTKIDRKVARIIVDIRLAVYRHREDCRQYEREVFDNCHVDCYCLLLSVKFMKV